MWQGNVLGILTAPAANAPMQPRDRVRAVPGRGLEGDRYYAQRGSFSRWDGPHREVTLIASEALEEMARETGVTLTPEQSRRNILTGGVPLNDLVGKSFYVGPVRMQGIRLCQPCKALARRTQKPDLLRALLFRGGLRARVLTAGDIQVGDSIAPAAPLRKAVAAAPAPR